MSSYHWPGFPASEAISERAVLRALRGAAFRIQGLPEAPLPGRAEAVLPARDAKLTAAREARKAKRQQQTIPA
jgi:hypothetical protein